MVGAQWLFARSGPGATNHFEAGGFVRSNDDVAYPNLMFHFLPLAIRYDGSRAGAAEHGYQVHVGPMYSDARGSLKIVSRDPQRPSGAALQLPLDRPGPARVGRGDPRRPPALAQPAFAPFDGGEISPGPAVETDEQILDWVARDAETALHPSCTCRMPTVVDPATMRVHGLEGLRVVDASVMPYVTNGNIYAPTMMIAEKAADLILGNEPLAPAEAGFYRRAA